MIERIELIFSNSKLKEIESFKSKWFSSVFLLFGNSIINFNDQGVIDKQILF